MLSRRALLKTILASPGVALLPVAAPAPFVIRLTSNKTITFTLPPTDFPAGFVLMLRQSNGPAKTVTWPEGLKWEKPQLPPAPTEQT